MKKEKYDISQEFNLKNLAPEEKCYIENRIISQIKWYDSKAIYAQKYYKKLSLCSFVLSSVIPIIALTNNHVTEKYIVAVISAIVSIMTYILNLYSYKDLWIKYRTNCELLKSKLQLFLYNKSSLKNNSSTEFQNFVDECEKCFSDEFLSWESLNKDQSSTNS